MASWPRRVLMTADAIGGVWNYSLELIRGLEFHGVEVLLAVMGGGVTDAKRAHVEALPNGQLAESPVKLEWMDAPWEDVAAAGDWLLRLEKRFQPDAIHLNGYAHGALPWRAPVVVVAHSCVESWFRAVRGETAPVQWDTYRSTVRRGLRSADVVVAPSRAMMNEILVAYGPLAVTQVILNGRDPEQFSTGEKEELVFAAGRVWDDAKNFFVLADAARAIEWPVFLAGESAHPEGGVRRMADVQLLGSLETPQLKSWYSRAAIFALPALYEPFGLSALEAALSGCALVLSDIPSLREIWGDAALYADPRNPAIWSQNLQSLIRDETKRLEFSERSGDRARRYSAATMTRNYLDAYEQAREKQQCKSVSSATPFDLTGTTETRISSAA